MQIGAFNWASYAATNILYFQLLGSFPLENVKKGTAFRQAQDLHLTDAQNLLLFVTKKFDRRFHRILSLMKYLSELLESDDADTTPDVSENIMSKYSLLQDILSTYITLHQPSIISDLKIAKKSSDRYNWFISLFLRFFVGVIFINRPNGIDFVSFLSSSRLIL